MTNSNTLKMTDWQMTLFECGQLLDLEVPPLLAGMVGILSFSLKLNCERFFIRVLSTGMGGGWFIFKDGNGDLVSTMTVSRRESPASRSKSSLKIVAFLCNVA